jgi:hypothetical protein
MPAQKAVPVSSGQYGATDGISTSVPRDGDQLTGISYVRPLPAVAVTVATIAKESTIDSDDSASYCKLKDAVREHRPKVIPENGTGKELPRVHIAISNAKRMLPDVYRDIKPQYLQNYLNGFCYEFNRRYFAESLFDRLLIAAISYKNSFRYCIR